VNAVERDHVAEPPGAMAGPERSEDRLVAQRAWFALVRGEPLPTLTSSHWKLLGRESRRHQMSGYTWQMLSQDPDRHGAPAWLVEHLRDVWIETSLRNAVLFRQTASMTRRLAERGIPVMLLKGAHLARFTYANAGMRNMADVDLMVPRDRLADAEQVFLGEGYGPTPRPDIEDFCSWSNHLPQLRKPGAPVFEIHWGIERPTSPFRIDIEGLWARSRAAELEDASVRLLGVEDLLLHLTLHASYHHRFQRSAVKGLMDVHVVIVRHEADIDWSLLAERAGEWDAAGFLYTTLCLATQILRTPVPPNVLAGLPHDPEDDAVVEIARRYVLGDVEPVPGVYIRLARSRSLRTRVSLMLQHLFLPRLTMERIYRLPEGTALWPYYAHRLGSLLFRRGRLLARSLFRTPAVRSTIPREEERLRIQRWAGYDPLLDDLTAFRTVIFTDIVGSTELGEELGAAELHRLVKLHDRLTEEEIHRHHGRVVKNTGDGILASFPDASMAVTCAQHVQRAFAAHRQAHAQDPLRIRIGMSAGEPMSQGRDLFGSVVNLAARICSRASADEIVVAPVVRELCRGKGFSFESLGEAELEGFAEAVTLYRVTWDE
jgi:class 3 adenylate cyclase